MYKADLVILTPLLLYKCRVIMWAVTSEHWTNYTTPFFGFCIPATGSGDLRGAHAGGWGSCTLWHCTWVVAGLVWTILFYPGSIDQLLRHILRIPSHNSLLAYQNTNMPHGTDLCTWWCLQIQPVPLMTSQPAVCKTCMERSQANSNRLGWQLIGLGERG